MAASKFIDIIYGNKKGTSLSDVSAITIKERKGKFVTVNFSPNCHTADPCPGALSIRYVTRGAMYFLTKNCKFKLVPGNFLLLKSDTSFNSYPCGESTVESFAIYFEPGLFDCFRENNPDNAGKPAFIEKIYYQSEKMRTAINKLQMQLYTAFANDQYFKNVELAILVKQLFAQLLIADAGVQVEINSMETTRPSARAEIYQRLNYARNFMESSYEQGISIEQVAEIACMNADYFTRLFKKQYGMTPVQYLIAKRMKEAGALLRQQKIAVTEVCRKVGYSDICSFGRLFKRYFGLTPEVYNKAMLQRKTIAWVLPASNNSWSHSLKAVNAGYSRVAADSIPEIKSRN